MRICDAHVHLGDSGPWQPYMKPTIYVEELIGLFDKFDVERAVVFPNPNVGGKYPKMNNYIAECVEKYPRRLIGFGRIDPRREDAIREFVRIKEQLKLCGLKLHPNVECFRPDHSYFDGFFKKINELRIPVLIHTGGFAFASPGLIVKIVKKYTNFTVILEHLSEGYVNTLKASENIFVETSGTISQLIELAVDVDEDRVLFGSDVLYYRYPTQTAIVEAAEISNKAKRKVFYENFQKLFQTK